MSNPHLDDGNISVYPPHNVVPSPLYPFDVATVYLQTLQEDGVTLLRFKTAPEGASKADKGSFYAYGRPHNAQGTAVGPPHWRHVPTAQVHGRIREFLNKAVMEHTDPKTLAVTHKKYVAAPGALNAIIAAVIERTATELMVPPCMFHTHPSITPDTIPHQIVVSNGILDMRTKVVVPHTPAYYPRSYAFHLTYDPAAKSPLWSAFLKTCFPVEEVGEEQATYAKYLLAVWMGYSISGQSDQQHVLWNYGASGTGKSTYTNAIQSLFAPQSRHTHDMESMKTTFWAGKLPGKRLLCINDISVHEKGADIVLSRIKNITGNDTVGATKKGVDSEESKLNLATTANANGLPNFHDTADAMARRIIPNAFNVVIPLEKRDLRLSEKLTEPHELSALLNYAISGYQMLYGYGHFAEGQIAAHLSWGGKIRLSEAGENAVEELSSNQTPIKSFITECLVLDPPQIPKGTTEIEGRPVLSETWVRGNKAIVAVFTMKEVFGDIYALYKIWAHDNDVNFPVLPHSLSRYINQLYPYLKARNGSTKNTNPLAASNEKDARTIYGVGMRKNVLQLTQGYATKTGNVLKVVTPESRDVKENYGE
jgi:P4 family phage/plasmid primase-like protien